MTPEIITAFIGAPANAVTLLVLLGVLFFQLIDRGLLKIGKWEGTGKKIDRLAQYANHETTHHLKEISQKLDTMNDKLEKTISHQERMLIDGVHCKERK